MSAKWDAKAEQFDRENPHVIDRLRGLALHAVAHGRRRLSINELFEVLRYEHGIKTQGDEFLLNNNYRAYYSRKLMATTPKLDGMFETRGGGQVGIADGLADTLPDAPSSSVYDDEDGDDWIEGIAA